MTGPAAPAPAEAATLRVLVVIEAPRIAPHGETPSSPAAMTLPKKKQRDGGNDFE
jgi:hypothetical protein